MIIAMLLTSASCGYVSSSPAEAQPSPEPAVSMSLDAQKEIISQNFEIWTLDSDYSQWFYTYADLNGNGRLEVIAATLQGSGLYTYANYYEVNSTYSGLDKLETSLKKVSPGPI